MVAFMLHCEYTTSCFMAKSVIKPNCRSSSNKQARQAFQLSECKHNVFVYLSVRLQV